MKSVNSVSRDTTMWCSINRWEEQENSSVNFSKQAEVTTQNLTETNIDKLGPEYDALTKYLNYLENKWLIINGDDYANIFSLERSNIYAQKTLKYGSSYRSEYHEDDMIRRCIAKVLPDLLMYSFLDSTKLMAAKENKRLGPEEISVVKKLNSCWPDDLLNKLLNSIPKCTEEEKQKAFQHKIYFLAVLIAALWQKSGNNQAFSYVAAFHAALVSEENEKAVKCAYSGDNFSWIEKNNIIAVPYCKFPSFFKRDASPVFKIAPKNKNNIDFYVDRDLAELCDRVIPKIINNLDELYKKDEGLISFFNKQKQALAKEITPNEEKKTYKIPLLWSPDFYENYKKWEESLEKENSNILSDTPLVELA